jgi:energy-coupling factor transporter ATP-binding protein EcfA2
MKKYLQNLFTSKKEEVKKKKTLISSLAPKVLTKKEDIEKVQPYLDKLNETIDTKGINNIALTGGYGSGKSTIIATFKELNPQYKFLNISLASFNKKKSDDSLTPSEKKTQKEELERLLEVSILQQIFYHVKPEEIPESRFKRIINIPDWKIWSISVGFILWVSSSILLLKYDYLDKINPHNWSNKGNFDWLALIVLLIAFIGLGLFSKLIIKMFSNSKINKVNIKGELELGDNVNKSVFNEHLEEILYFFERTKYDVVLIEDLDSQPLKTT